MVSLSPSELPFGDRDQRCAWTPALAVPRRRGGASPSCSDSSWSLMVATKSCLRAPVGERQHWNPGHTAVGGRPPTWQGWAEPLHREMSGGSRQLYLVGAAPREPSAPINTRPLVCPRLGQSRDEAEGPLAWLQC